MRTSRMLALGASLLVLAGACSTGGGSSPIPTAQPVRVGSAGFGESALIAEIYAQVLEANGYTVTRQLQIGPRTQTVPALESGQIDLMPEYIGSLLEFINEGAGEATHESQATYDRLQERLSEHQLTALGYAPAQDKNAFVVRPEIADEHGLTKMSDLAAVQNELTWGLPAECETNALCGGVLTDVYGINFDEITVVELGACGAEIATALSASGAGAVDIGELCSTQGDLARFPDLVVLEDDQNTQPAENIAPVARDAWLEQAGGAEALAAILDPVSSALTDEELIAMNERVSIDQEDFDTVAREWLTEKDLLP
jgi:osmoprotectant transport system substrate-binding protein